MLGVIGDIVQDVVVWQLEARRDATDTRSDITIRRGGSAANVAAFAARRYPTRFVGCVGDDLAAGMLRQELSGHGVDVRLQVSATEDTGVIVLLIDEHGERTMFPSRGANARLGPIEESWLDDIEILHITGYSFESPSAAAAVREAVARQHTRGGKVFMDVSSAGMIRHYGGAEFLDLMVLLRPDFVSANEDECRLLGLAEGGRPAAALARLRDATLLARRGSRATTVIRGGDVIASVPVPAVTGVRDLTGAGDAFNAGFLAEYLGGDGDPVRSCEAGHALAARVVRSPGATESA